MSLFLRIFNFIIFFPNLQNRASWVACFPPLVPLWWRPSSCAVYKWQMNLFITNYHYNSQCFSPLLFPWISAWSLRGSLHTWKPCKVAVQSTFEQRMYDIFQYKNKRQVVVFPNLEPIVGTYLYTEYLLINSDPCQYKIERQGSNDSHSINNRKWTLMGSLFSCLFKVIIIISSPVQWEWK